MLRAQWHAVVFIATAIRLPGLSRAVDRIAQEPTLEHRRIGGVPTRVARPRGQGPWPTIVFLNGSTRNGCADPAANGVVRGLARGGYLTFAPELPGSKEGELSTETLEAALAVVRGVVREPSVRDGRVALLGVSVGASLALLVAAEPDLADRASVVVGLAPYGDLDRIVRLATTGWYGEEGGHEVARRVRLVLARSLVGELLPGSDRDRLLEQLRGLEDNGSEPLELSEEGLGADGCALVALLSNRDPRRYASLRAALPEQVRASLGRLSPLEVMPRIAAPVELASAPIDGYFPVGESRALAARGGNVQLTLTSSIEHVRLRPSIRSAGDLIRFDLFVVRALRICAQGGVV